MKTDHATIERWTKQLRALEDYRLSMLRIGEQSEAADREEMRVLRQISVLRAALKNAETFP